MTTRKLTLDLTPDDVATCFRAVMPSTVGMSITTLVFGPVTLKHIILLGVSVCNLKYEAQGGRASSAEATLEFREATPHELDQCGVNHV